LALDVPTAFVSYSRDDSEFVIGLAKELKAAGAQVWVDQLDIPPGERWESVIQDALNKSARVLVILSPSAVKSTNVSDEVTYALSKHKTVIPVLYRNCEIPYRLSPFQNVDFTTDYVHALNALLETLRPERPPITWRLVEWRIKIHDSSGTNASIWKMTDLVANERNITTLVDRNFTSSGKLRFQKASLGNISRPTDEGGSFSVTTVLSEPLPVGQEVRNILTIKASNSFVSPKESFKHSVDDECKKVRIVVELPPDRPAISASAYRVVRETRYALPDNVLSAGNLHLELNVENAPVGSDYILEWHW
jgi:hypothetical protein